MQQSEVTQVRDDMPVLLIDGRIGLLVAYPSRSSSLCGIQVYGEETHRWLECSELEKSAFGALRQIGATMPVNSIEVEEHGRAAHLLLSMAWARCAADWLGVVR